MQEKPIAVPPDAAFLTEAQASILTGYSPSYFQKARHFNRPGAPPFIRRGRSIRFSRAALMAWAENRDPKEDA